MGVFERYLSVWVGLCIVVGIALGNVVPALFQFIAGLEYAHVNLPVAVLIWVMIYPMMVQVDFTSIKDVGKNPRYCLPSLLIGSLSPLQWPHWDGCFSGLSSQILSTPRQQQNILRG